VVGFKGLLTGIKFPVAKNYVSISQLAGEGEAIGTIVVGVQRFTVSLLVGVPKIASETPPQRRGVVQGMEIVVTGGLSVEATPGSSLSAIARAQYGDYRLWPLIYVLNKQRIGPNPNVVKAGTKLLLLPLSRYTQAELAAARQQAPTWKAYPH
jgi:nucleoid-associated protein YgaU